MTSQHRPQTIIFSLALLWLFIGPGCVSVSQSRRGQKMPFFFPRGQRLFVGPVYLSSIGFYIEVPPDRQEDPVQVLPDGIRLGDEWIVMKSGVYKVFQVGRKSCFFQKGEMPFVFRPAAGSSIPMKFRDLPVTLETKPGRRPIVVWDRDGMDETMTYGGGRVIFRQDRFSFEPPDAGIGRRLSPAEVRAGIAIARNGDIRVGE